MFKEMIKSDLGTVVDSGKYFGWSIISLVDDVFEEVRWSKPVLYGAVFVAAPVYIVKGFVQGVKEEKRKRNQKGLPGEWENKTMDLVGRDDILEAI